MMTQEMRKSSEFPPMSSSFWSLPNDVVLNILARISRIHHPSLSLVSKSFRSLLASRELDVTRNLIGKTENFIYLCLKLPRHNPKPRWFILAPVAKQKLIPILSFPHEHPQSPSVVSVGSEIYIIGGFVMGKRTKRVFLLDCRSHQWRILPEMQVPRGNSAAGLIDGKIYVLGGCIVGENSGEIYDPKTQTWEPLSPTTLAPDSSVQESLAMDRWLLFWTNFCFVGEEKILCTSWRCIGKGLPWCGLDENLRWRKVKGLEGLHGSSQFLSLANPGGGRRLTVWWVSYTKEEEDRDLVREVEIWCAEISFERRSKEELFGIVEWSKMIYTMEHSESGGFISFLCSATVMH